MSSDLWLLLPSYQKNRYSYYTLWAFAERAWLNADDMECKVQFHFKSGLKTWSGILWVGEIGVISRIVSGLWIKRTLCFSRLLIWHFSWIFTNLLLSVLCLIFILPRMHTYVSFTIRFKWPVLCSNGGFLIIGQMHFRLKAKDMVQCLTASALLTASISRAQTRMDIFWFLALAPVANMTR